MPKRWRALALFLVLAAPLAFLFALPPIPQDPQYHGFADARTMLGVPNFLNVVSNVAFLAVGGIGLSICLGARAAGATLSWTVFFAGTTLVAFGSAWYHLAPSNASLVWDRLPMTIAFMALFAALMSEHIEERLERALLPAALLTGALSIAWWHHADDLRFYAWVQFAPLLAVVLLLTAFPGRYGHRIYLAYAAGFYGAAKAAEAMDAAIFALTSNTVSGHTLKHLLAALAPYCVYLMLRRRAASEPRAAPA